MGVLSKQATKQLIGEQQIEAVTRVYTQGVEERKFGTVFPALSHQKKQIFECASSLAPGLSDKKLYREVCKQLKLAVPDGCYTEAEMRNGLVAFHFRGVDKLTVATYSDEYGPSKATLFRQEKRLAAALELAGVPTEPVATGVPGFVGPRNMSWNPNIVI